MIKFGVVIPTYKRAHLVSRAIDSVLNQSYQNFVICVVEDCSPDNTREIIKLKYGMNEKVHYIRLDKNSGVNKARNTALDYLLSDEINCDFITFLDDDDYFLDNFFTTSIEVINSFKVDWFTFNKVYENGNKITLIDKYGYLDYIYDYYCGLKMSGDACMIFSSKLIKNIRFEDRINAREYLFLIQVAYYSKMFTFDFNGVVCDYLEDGLSKSQKKESKETRIKVLNIENEILNQYNLSLKKLTFIIYSLQLLRSMENKKVRNIFRFSRKLIVLILKSLFRRSNVF